MLGMTWKQDVDFGKEGGVSEFMEDSLAEFVVFEL
jgi:hypothetical protein